MYIKEKRTNTNEGTVGEESDPPPPEPISEDIPSEYNSPFRPFEDVCNEIEQIEIYRPFYKFMVGSKNPEERTSYI